MNMEHLAATTNEEGSILGHLVWWSIPEQLISKETLEDHFEALDIKKIYMPKPIKTWDAFRRASSMIERKRVTEEVGDTSVNLLCREAKAGSDVVVRFIVKELVDAKNERLGYVDDAAKLTLNKKTGLVDVVVNDNSPIVRSSIEAFLYNYEQFLISYDGQALRRLAIDILNDLSPTSARKSGGVYIVPCQYQDELRKLVALIRMLKPDASYQSEAYMVPLVDSRDNRDMIREKIASSVDDMIKKMASALKDPEVERYEVERILAESRLMVHTVSEYEVALKESLEYFNQRVEILQNQMLASLDKL